MNLNINLDEAEIEGNELNPLSYNPDDYPTIDELILGIMSNIDKEPAILSLDELSLNGEVINDLMPVYLDHEGESSSGLKEVLKNPAAYFFYKHEKQKIKEDDKPHFKLGTFSHLAFLEPQLFDKVIAEPKHSLASIDGVNKLIEFWQKFVITQFKNNSSEILNEAATRFTAAGGDMTKLDGKKNYLSILKELTGVTVIDENHKAIIDLLKRYYNMYGGGIIPLLLKGAQVEHSFYAVDEITGLKIKVRPDAFNIEENIGVNAIISVKTTSASDMGKFIYDSAKLKYELSEGYYQDVVSHVTGRKFNTTIMIVLQTVPPYLPAVFFWHADDLANGRYKARYALDTIKDCKSKGLYPGFESLAEAGHYGIIQMKQPAWAEKLLQPVDLED